VRISTSRAAFNRLLLAGRTGRLNPIQQKFDFHPTMCYNSKAKLASQRLIKLDIRAQGSDEIMGGLSEIKR
jgi:hypothetical protein